MQMCLGFSFLFTGLKKKLHLSSNGWKRCHELQMWYVTRDNKEIKEYCDKVQS